MRSRRCGKHRRNSRANLREFFAVFAQHFAPELDFAQICAKCLPDNAPYVKPCAKVAGEDSNIPTSNIEPKWLPHAPLCAPRGGPCSGWCVGAVPPYGLGCVLKSPGPPRGIGIGILKHRALRASKTPAGVSNPRSYAHRADLAGTAGEGPARHLGTVRPLKRHQAPADRLSSPHPSLVEAPLSRA